MYKLDRDHKYFTIAMYACAVLAVAILLVTLGLNFGAVRAAYDRFASVTSPIVIGLIVAYICNAPVRFSEKKLLRFPTEKPFYRKLKRILAILMSYAVILLIASLMIWMVIPEILENYETLIQQVSNIVIVAMEKLDGIFKAFGIENIADTVDKYTDRAIETVAGLITKWSGMAVIVLVKITLGVIISFFVLLYKESLRAGCKKFFSAVLPKQVYAEGYGILKSLDKAFGQYFVGSIFDSLLLGTILFLILWSFRFPYYSVVSVICCVTNVIPYFGPFIGAIPSFIIIFISDPIKAFWFLAIILLLQQIDGNIIAPRILGDAVGLSSLWVVIAVTVMGGLFGLVGMFIGIPLFSVLFALIKRMVESRLQKKGLPCDLHAYTEVFSGDLHELTEAREAANAADNDRGDTASATEVEHAE